MSRPGRQRSTSQENENNPPQIKRYSRPSEDAQPQLWAGEFDELQQLLEEMD